MPSKWQAGNRSPLEPAASHFFLSAAHHTLSPAPGFDSCGVAHCPALLFPSGCYTSPGFEDFPRSRSLRGRLLASRCLPSATPPSPVRSLMWAEPEESSPGLLPFFQMRCWPESGGLFLRKLFPCVYGWKRCKCDTKGEVGGGCFSHSQ